MDTQIPSFGPYPRFRTKEPKRSWLGRSGPMGGLFARVPRRRRSINPARLWNFGIRLTGGNPWVLRLNAGSCFLPSRMCCFFLVKKWFSLSGISEHPEKTYIVLQVMGWHGVIRSLVPLCGIFSCWGPFSWVFMSGKDRGLHWVVAWIYSATIEIQKTVMHIQLWRSLMALETPIYPHISHYITLYIFIYPFYNHFITIILPLYYNTT